MSLKEIAERAGVSVSTASRALNDPQYRCSSPEIRERIWEAAREMQYVPNQAARSLRMSQGAASAPPCRLDILVTRTDGGQADPFFAELIRCLEGELKDKGLLQRNIWHVSDLSDDRRASRVHLPEVVERLYAPEEQDADGLVIIGKCVDRALPLLRKHCKNIVSINRNSTNYSVDEVLCDGEKVALTAMGHLAGLGHKDIAYIGDCHHESRYRGYLSALADRGLFPNPRFIVETRQTEAEGEEGMRMLLEEDPPPTAVFCANDGTALGALRAVASRPRSLPPISVISCDDIAGAAEARPSLTTIHLAKEEMAHHAVGLLLDRIRGGHKSVARIEVEGRLVIRESCFAVGGEGGKERLCSLQ